MSLAVFLDLDILMVTHPSFLIIDYSPMIKSFLITG